MLFFTILLSNIIYTLSILPKNSSSTCLGLGCGYYNSAFESSIPSNVDSSIISLPPYCTRAPDPNGYIDWSDSTKKFCSSKCLRRITHRSKKRHATTIIYKCC